ncbi:MAG: YceI family protein [Myxococcaceae bacterium]
MRTAQLVTALAALSFLAACPDPAKDKVKATVSTPTATPEKKAEAAAPLKDATAFPFTQAESKLTWVGAKVTGKHDGGFATFGGIIEVAENDPAKSRVRAEIDMSSLFCDSEKLTGHLKGEDFFNVAQFPQSKFTSTAIKKLDDGKFEVTGDLTMHGVTKTITFPAAITLGAEEVTVAAEFAINRKDFNIVYPGKPDDLIADNVALKLDIHGKKKAPAAQ